MRLIIISNRLPITITEENNQLQVQKSIGGVATGVHAFLQHWKKINQDAEYLWIGWPGISLKKNKEEELLLKLKAHHCYPIVISELLTQKFYAGFCNKTLWPLFHSLSSYAIYEKDQWQVYQKVNELFLTALINIIQPNDIVWVHDYQLLLLPKLLRDKFPDLSIGFFLHIPFPAFEIFQCLPRQCRAELLSGLLGADLIGFHTHDYSQNFSKCVLRILGYEQNMGFIPTKERFVKVDTYPMGIDFNDIETKAKSNEVIAEKTKLSNSIHNTRLILSIDRLDYTKGIANRLRAYELFLNENIDWRGKITLLLIIAPSRESVTQYQTMKKQLDELVGSINGKFGNISWTPILYQYRSFTLEQLIALYTLCNIALVTPLRDGMNLIAKEYLAAHCDNQGMLILSETAGAAKELLEAIIINPNSKEEIVAAIKEALEMSEVEKINRNILMRSRLRRYDVHHWGNEFINDLITTKHKQSGFLARFISHQGLDLIVNQFKRTNKRLLLLDYDGTLSPFFINPNQAIPNASLLQLLTNLTNDTKNAVVILSGRDKYTLDRWFAGINLQLAAEHGIWIKDNNNWQMSRPLTKEWHAQILPVLENFMDRLPGTFVEKKEFSIVWHYRGADPEKGEQLAKELTEHLVNLTANVDIQILLGNKIVEAKCAGVGKDTAALYFIAKNDYDFILAIGDDATDDDTFRVLPQHAYSIKVGINASHAKFNLRSQNDVITLLSRFV